MEDTDSTPPAESPAAASTEESLPEAEKAAEPLAAVSAEELLPEAERPQPHLCTAYESFANACRVFGTRRSLSSSNARSSP